ncbi:solute carrier family 52, riboflavin transporter, member 3-B-like, partial [Rhipicephalus sanguineus]|uniref:solute carrier family 52, riboflavin transporter, member 3-B-like n=1 Tax=Rhipicephalus sanguineus TaxID=34632 RepID=UPI0020C33FD0
MDGSPAPTSDTEPQRPASSRWARILVSICSLLFGVSAWVSVNGLWVQMPLLVPVLPEGWNLGSVLVIVIQVANVGPLVYTLAWSHLGIRSSVHATLFVGLAASVLMVFFWRRTVGEHSVAFIALAFFLACVDCTSSVLYMPFMARYPPQFLF